MINQKTPKVNELGAITYLAVEECHNLVSAKQAAIILGIPYQKTLQYLQDGKLRGDKIDGRWRVLLQPLRQLRLPFRGAI